MSAASFDPQLLDDLARVFAFAALEKLIAEVEAQRQVDAAAKPSVPKKAKKKSTPT